MTHINPDCPKCDGVGYLPNPDGEGKVECLCQLRNRALEYLGPDFRDALYRKSDDPTSAVGKNLLFHNMKNSSEERTRKLFNSHAKSFLLNTGMRYKFAVHSLYGLVKIMLDDGNEFMRLHDIDLLFILLPNAPFNSHYTRIFSSILDHRIRKGHATWVYTPFHISDGLFANNYSPDMARVILANFITAGV